MTGRYNGMPDELVAVVEGFDPAIRERVLDNWEAIGDPGRDLYRAYLARGLFRRGRKMRVQLAGTQLINPAIGYLGVSDGGGMPGLGC